MHAREAFRHVSRVVVVDRDGSVLRSALLDDRTAVLESLHEVLEEGGQARRNRTKDAFSANVEEHPSGRDVDEKRVTVRLGDFDEATILGKRFVGLCWRAWLVPEAMPL